MQVAEQVVQEIDEMWHRRGGFFTTSPQHCSRLQQLRSHAVTEDWMIPFAAYTAAETPNAFQSAGTQPNLLLLSVGILTLV